MQFPDQHGMYDDQFNLAHGIAVIYRPTEITEQEIYKQLLILIQFITLIFIKLLTVALILIGGNFFI